jgi:hypothetical protein
VVTGSVEADATVRESAPTTNFGASTLLSVADSPRQRTFFRVAVNGIGQRSVVAARLRLQVAQLSGAGSDSGGRIRVARSCGWNEMTVTWDTQPPVRQTTLDQAGPVVPGQIVDLDVTAEVGGDGVYCFRLDSTSANAATYGSREGNDAAPRLIIELAG